MKIVLATTEVEPFAKTGGLADVCGSLPIELAKLGHEPVVLMPAFRQVHQGGQPIESTGVEFDLPIGGKTVRGEAHPCGLRPKQARGSGLLLVHAPLARARRRREPGARE